MLRYKIVQINRKDGFWSFKGSSLANSKLGKLCNTIDKGLISLVNGQHRSRNEESSRTSWKNRIRVDHCLEKHKRTNTGKKSSHRPVQRATNEAVMCVMPFKKVSQVENLKNETLLITQCWWGAVSWPPAENRST